MEAGKLFFNKKIIATAILYFLLSGILLFKFGIQTDGEALKFIDTANRIINGQEPSNGVFGYFYVVYSLIVALCIKLSVSFIFVAILQIGLSFFAAVCLYKLFNRILGNNTISFFFFVVYLICYPIQKWNFFLYSESVHTSLLVIGLYCLNTWLHARTRMNLLALSAVSLLILFSRPVGVLFVLSFFVVLMSWLYRNKMKLQFYVLGFVAIIVMVLLLNSPYTTFVNPDSIRRMEIICQVPQVKDTVTYREYNREGLYSAFLVIKNEIGVGNFFMLGFKKLAYFFGMYRSYYSWPHNLLLICFTVLYPFALIGVFSKASSAFYYARLFSISYLLFTTAGIFFTCDEWSNRFIGPAFSFVLVLATEGFPPSMKG